MKKILALILCFVMIASVAVMTSCGKADENDKPAVDDTAADSKDSETKDIGIETIEPVDTSKIEPAQGGDIVGEWLSDALQLVDSENGTTLNYNTTFIFREDGTLLFKLSLSGSNAEFTKVSYTVDGGKLIVDGTNPAGGMDLISLTDATYTVDGDVLLINSDELNVAFRRK
ncbi:MAG: hypothetical protein IJC50_00270 [Clostridia bacterium]|nr:hypothetical protein [Clostridia bacterium]